MAKKRFTKYPSNYVSASTVDTSFKQITNSEFNKIVESYRRAGQGSKYTNWSLIVAELKGTYGLDVAKELADAICYKDVDAICYKDVDACDAVDVNASSEQAYEFLVKRSDDPSSEGKIETIYAKSWYEAVDVLNEDDTVEWWQILRD